MALNTRIALAAAAALASAGASMAGGYTPPVAEPAPVAVSPVVSAATPLGWSGAYVGGSVGYARSNSDELDVTGGAGTDTPGDLKMDGAVGSVHAGYRWQNNNWVYGAEVSATGGNVEDTLDAGGYTASEKMKYAVGLKGQLGYLVTPETMVYGSVGATHGKFDVAYDGPGGTVNDDFSKTGYSLGLGVERKLTDAWSVRGDYEFMNFGDETVTAADGSSSRFEPEVHKVSLGVNYNF